MRQKCNIPSLNSIRRQIIISQHIWCFNNKVKITARRITLNATKQKHKLFIRMRIVMLSTPLKIKIKAHWPSTSQQ